MKLFPNMVLRTEDDVLVLCRYILKERSNDVNDFNNLKNVFMSGRKVSREPSASNDILDSDRIGDFNYNSSYLYIVVNNSGTAEWRRIGLGTW